MEALKLFRGDKGTKPQLALENLDARIFTFLVLAPCTICA